MEKYRPDIYLFNPTCEYAIANSHTSWQPNLLLQKMEEDLGTLPLFFANPGDVLLVKKIPPESFNDMLAQISVHTPHFINISKIKGNRYFTGTKINRLLPWGWSPAVHRLLEPLKPLCSEEFLLSPVATWKDEYRELYSRKFALEILEQLLPLNPSGLFIYPDQLPRICTTRAEIEVLLNVWGKIMVKAPWSSSGRGLQRITHTPVIEKVWEKLLAIINDQGYAVVEPYLEKVIDMALQFNLHRGRIRFTGISRFITDGKGQYQGNYLNGWPQDMAPGMSGFTEKMAGLLAPKLCQVLEKSKLAYSYEGNFGVDTLIFKDINGNLRINPCLEINVRQNMGLLSLNLEKILYPGRKGIFQIYFHKGISFKKFSDKMIKSNPLEIKDNKIYKGYMPLTPSDESTIFGAYILLD